MSSDNKETSIELIVWLLWAMGAIVTSYVWVAGIGHLTALIDTMGL